MDNEKKIARYIKPMLARETGSPFDNKDWLYEIKWDGYRAIAEKKGNRSVLLYSRNGLDFAKTYPTVVEQLRSLEDDVVLDGEIVVLGEDGKPDFQLLQHYSQNQDRPIQYYVFDLLELNGKDVKDLPLLARKELLQKVIPTDGKVVRYSEHIVDKGKAFFEAARKKNLEGIMAKKKDSVYVPGSRTGNWLKIKNHQTAEAIIAGYTRPAGSRKYFGALVLATKKGNKLVYTGNAGTGFNHRSLQELFKLFQPMVQQQSPFDQKETSLIKNSSKITWLKPRLVCEVQFTEVTADGRLRHPVFLRLRNDKNARDMNTDQLQPTPNGRSGKAKRPAKEKVDRSMDPIIEVSGDTDKIYTFGRNKVTVTHFTKIYFPAEKVTKGDVVDYYVSIAPYILPYLKGRPESLLRNPNGIKGKGFFQKDAADDTPPFVHCKQIHSESTNKEVNYIVCDNIETLVYLNNLGCIELNPWHSDVTDLDNPDYLMIDIDPSDKNTFEQVIQVALAVKNVFDRAGAVCYCKTSGASGMHIYVPAGKKYSYEQVKDFAYLVCMMVHDQLSGFTTLERNLQKRGKNRIYLDYLQNRRGQTISSVYSLRPKPGATVSTPLLWEEVKQGLSPGKFTIHNTLKRVEEMGDLFAGVLGKGIDLAGCIENLQKPA